jgi:hypothetical protein
MVKIMNKLFATLSMLFCVGSIAFGQETSTRLLTPRADSPTAMTRCGQELEKVKAGAKLPHRYVFTGQEKLTAMQYCVEGKNSLTDDRNTYQVPAGTVGWLDDEGLYIVLEECVNLAHCEGCSVAPPPEPVAELCPCPPAQSEVQLPPAPEDVPLKEFPPLPDEWVPAEVNATMVWENGRPLWSKFPVLNCGYELIPGLGGFKRHSVEDIVEKATCALGIAGGIYAGVSRGAATAAVKISSCVGTWLPDGAWSPCGSH